MYNFLKNESLRLNKGILSFLFVFFLISESFAFANSELNQMARRGPNLLHGVNEYVMQVQIRDANNEVVKNMDSDITQALVQYVKSEFKSNKIDRNIISKSISDEIFLTIEIEEAYFRSGQKPELSRTEEIKKGILFIRIIVMMSDDEKQSPNIRILLNHDLNLLLNDQQEVISEGVVWVGLTGILDAEELLKCRYYGIDKLQEFVFCRMHFFLENLVVSAINDRI